MIEDKPSVSAAPTPETDALGNKPMTIGDITPPYPVLVEWETLCCKLERDRNEARRGFERMSDTCFAAIRRAEAAESELAAAKEQLAATKELIVPYMHESRGGVKTDWWEVAIRLRRDLLAAKKELAAERKRADALQADMDKIREAYEAMKNG